MIIKVKKLPWNIKAITIFPFIFTESKDNITLNHEKIHMKQQLEMLVIFFYLWYFIEGALRDYRKISFEKEAYNNEENFDYLKKRKLFSWIKYL